MLLVGFINFGLYKSYVLTSFLIYTKRSNLDPVLIFQMWEYFLISLNNIKLTVE